MLPVLNLKTECSIISLPKKNSTNAIVLYLSSTKLFCIIKLSLQIFLISDFIQ